MNILIFSGTKNGRELITALSLFDIKIITSSMSKYGSDLLAESDNIINLWGKLSSKDITLLIKNYNIDLVIDSTHPYAKEVSGNIIESCQNADKTLLRFEREHSFKDTDGIHFKTMESLLEFLKHKEGNILFSTGVNDVPKIVNVLDKNRVFLRVLPVKSSLDTIKMCKMPLEHVITVKPPFTTKDNIKHLTDFDITFMVTKDSGIEGYCKEKLEACYKTEKILLIIDRPDITYNNLYYKESDIVKEVLRRLHNGSKIQR